MDRVNVKPHFSLETTILLCPATLTSLHKSHCPCPSRSNGRIRPEENSNCPKQGHPVVSFEGGADKLESSLFQDFNAHTQTSLFS